MLPNANFPMQQLFLIESFVTHSSDVLLFLLVSSIEDPPPDYEGEVDIVQFWHKISLEIVSRGLIPSKD